MKSNCSVIRSLFLGKVPGSLSILSQLSSRNFQIGKVEGVQGIVA